MEVDSMYSFNSSDELLAYIKSMKVPQNDGCPLTAPVNLISGKWELKVLFYLLKYDTLRFGELKKHLPGITNTVLTTVLKKFEQAGIINRVQFNEVPPHVEYSLTESGKYVIHIFFELTKWANH